MEPSDILTFWFGDLDRGFADSTHRDRWYAFDPAFDGTIVERFGATLAAAAGGGLQAWLATPEGRLAFILVTDQFSRHIHRGSAAAFATDSLARQATEDGVQAGMDRALAFDHRAFFYMPFMHSESLIDQHTAVGLFSQLRDDTPAPHRHHTGGSLRHAHQHRDIIVRFGRFPHRNGLLDRTSTDAERAYLTDASGFGQAATSDA